MDITFFAPATLERLLPVPRGMGSFCLADSPSNARACACRGFIYSAAAIRVCPTLVAGFLRKPDPRRRPFCLTFGESRLLPAPSVVGLLCVCILRSLVVLARAESPIAGRPLHSSATARRQRRRRPGRSCVWPSVARGGMYVRAQPAWQRAHSPLAGLVCAAVSILCESYECLSTSASM